jgi:hypothetical protein
MRRALSDSGLWRRVAAARRFSFDVEPAFVNLSFGWAQLDERLAGNRGYGDRFENNNTALTATNLGASLTSGSFSLPDLSVDDNADVDVYRFGVTSASTVATITVRPVGATYLEGPQNSNAVARGTPFNSLSSTTRIRVARQ